MSCRITDCDNETKGREICGMHRMRLNRGAPVHGPTQERLGHFQMMCKAAIRMADAEDDTDYQLAVDCLRKAARKWVASVEGEKRKAGKADESVKGDALGDSASEHEPAGRARESGAVRDQDRLAKRQERQSGRPSGLRQGTSPDSRKPLATRDSGTGEPHGVVRREDRANGHNGHARSRRSKTLKLGTGR